MAQALLRVEWTTRGALRKEAQRDLREDGKVWTATVV